MPLLRGRSIGGKPCDNDAIYPQAPLLSSLIYRMQNKIARNIALLPYLYLLQILSYRRRFRPCHYQCLILLSYSNILVSLILYLLLLMLNLHPAVLTLRIGKESRIQGLLCIHSGHQSRFAPQGGRQSQKHLYLTCYMQAHAPARPHRY